MKKDLVGCSKCSLSQDGRSQVVFGCGKDINPDLMFVGEAPGADEDQDGEPFLGRAGQLLMKMAASIGYSREEIFLDNINKCRPEKNRKPTTLESKTCGPHVEAEITLINPAVLVCVGATSANYLLNNKESMKNLVGKWFTYKGFPTRVIYHPAYILRLHGEQEMAKKKEVWRDLLEIQARVKEIRGTPSPTSPAPEG